MLEGHAIRVSWAITVHRLEDTEKMADGTFHYLAGQKSVERRVLCSENIDCRVFWGYKIVKKHPSIGLHLCSYIHEHM